MDVTLGALLVVVPFAVTFLLAAEMFGTLSALGILILTIMAAISIVSGLVLLTNRKEEKENEK